MCDFGHAGDGGLHLNVLFPTEVGPPSDAAAGGDPPSDRRPRRSPPAAATAPSTASARSTPSAGWPTTPPIEQRLVAALKDVVDPHRILGHPAHPYNRL